MTKDAIEAQLNRLVTVVLESGPRLTGTLQRSKVAVGLLEFEVLGEDGHTHQGFEWNDVQQIIPLHPAEAAAEEEMCSCPHSDDVAADHEGWLQCPVHQPDMSDAAQHQAYVVWRAGVFAAIREAVPAKDAGQWSKIDGDYENVVFQISAAEKPDGNHGKMVVQINLTRSAPPTRKHLAFVECNWRTDSEADVAQKALKAYEGLLRA